jgi:hypothetical protein
VQPAALAKAPAAEEDEYAQDEEFEVHTYIDIDI